MGYPTIVFCKIALPLQFQYLCYPILYPMVSFVIKDKVLAFPYQRLLYLEQLSLKSNGESFKSFPYLYIWYLVWLSFLKPLAYVEILLEFEFGLSLRPKPFPQGGLKPFLLYWISYFIHFYTCDYFCGNMES